MTDLRLTEIWIYPIKSLGGIPLTSARVMGKGLQYDRRFMLVGPDGVCLTQRERPIMALFKLSLDGDQILIRHKNDVLALPAVPTVFAEPEQVRIWDDTVAAQGVGAEYDQWFSSRMGMNAHLVYFPEGNARPVDPQYKVNDEHVGLADAYPFLVIGQSSLNDLNSRLDTPLPMNRFRPNLVIAGADAYAEDTWRDFRIGDTRFVGVKPCARCVLTTVDQDTAVKGKEPLKTLAKYRSRNNKIYFGQNAVALDLQYITVGDPVTIQTTNS
jgi:uncharacterized protein YcbX